MRRHRARSQVRDFGHCSQSKKCYQPFLCPVQTSENSQMKRLEMRLEMAAGRREVVRESGKSLWDRISSCSTVYTHASLSELRSMPPLPTCVKPLARNRILVAFWPGSPATYQILIYLLPQHDLLPCLSNLYYLTKKGGRKLFYGT